jgi:deoxyribodipyrimidine photo-lyase
MILWFRNDLRVRDNPALQYFLSNKKIGDVGVAIFFICEAQWKTHHWSDIKIDFIKRHVEALAAELNVLNINLLTPSVDNFEDQISFLKSYCSENNITEVVANQELEFNEQQRDFKLSGQSIALTLFEADVIVSKGRVVNKSDAMYKVFTPFKRAWLTYVKEHGFEYLGSPLTIEQRKSALENASCSKETIIESSLSNTWPLVSTIEKAVIPTFLQEKLEDYAEYRDIPSVKGTSGLSPYLAIGALSPRYLLTLLLNRNPELLSMPDRPVFTWLNELIWREFYRNLIQSQPALSKHKCFSAKYQQTQWPNNPEWFKSWCQGKTGYPLVDAAMRQLNETGWMHNRLRMVVASFLTKHLLIDWRWGEKYFMQHLIDGDLAANNGGWQWAASTGCDAQPYFRIFNPITQSKRFDPNGEFIRRYLPELAKIPDKDIHFPHQYLVKNSIEAYWPAIVDHKEARLRALDFYK